MCLTGVTGSSLEMTSSQARGHFSVALYRTTTPKHEPGRSVCGNGLLTSFQCLCFRLSTTPVTCKLHSPMLQIESVRSAAQQAFTPPKQREPVTTSLPGGASPETAIVLGLDGSSLATVMAAAFDPKLVGWKRIGISTASPAPIVKG